MRLIRLTRVACNFADVTQQIHSFLARGVKPFQAASVLPSESTALRTSSGVLCTGPIFLWFTVMFWHSAGYALP